ncbi:MAG: dephospho-CoA kinase [Promicromonosporaceae bacterium]|nr:dephospho-CoA kinase [Promicromonosporaceae bacterium]
MLRVGLTGGIGAGKSTASARFREMGAVVIDYDVLARLAISPGSPVLSELSNRFGPRLLNDDGELNRDALASLIFTNPAIRNEVESLIHPEVFRLAAQAEGEAVARDPNAVVVHDVPLLVEKGLAGWFDAVVVVEAEHDVKVRRLIERGLSEAQAEARIAAGATDAERAEVADYRLNGNGAPELLAAQIDGLWPNFSAKGAATRSRKAQGFPVRV